MVNYSETELNQVILYTKILQFVNFKQYESIKNN